MTEALGTGTSTPGGSSIATSEADTNSRLVFLIIDGAAVAQLPGRLFSPSDKSKKLSHHLLLHFPIGMGSYHHNAKYQGVFS